MTDAQKTAIRLLSYVTFPVASFDKRFYKDMAAKLAAEQAHPENVITLTDKQDACLIDKVHRYRRQHGRCACLLCLKPAENPYQAELFEEGKVG